MGEFIFLLAIVFISDIIGLLIRWRTDTTFMRWLIVCMIGNAIMLFILRLAYASLSDDQMAVVFYVLSMLNSSLAFYIVNEFIKPKHK
jgi:hypothetical protein